MTPRGKQKVDEVTATMPSGSLSASALSRASSTCLAVVLFLALTLLSFLSAEVRLEAVPGLGSAGAWAPASLLLRLCLSSCRTEDRILSRPRALGLGPTAAGEPDDFTSKTSRSLLPGEAAAGLSGSMEASAKISSMSRGTVATWCGGGASCFAGLLRFDPDREPLRLFLREMRSVCVAWTSARIRSILSR